MFLFGTARPEIPGDEVDRAGHVPPVCLRRRKRGGARINVKPGICWACCGGSLSVAMNLTRRQTFDTGGQLKAAGEARGCDRRSGGAPPKSAKAAGFEPTWEAILRFRAKAGLDLARRHKGRVSTLPFFLCVLDFRRALAASERALYVQRKYCGDMHVDSTREPMFNIPVPVIVVIALLWIVHAIRTWVLSDHDAGQVLLLFSFIPERYGSGGSALPGGFGPAVWSFVTYALLHTDLQHLIFNSIGLLIFGSLVARRFGALRFFGFLALTAVAGAAAYLLTHSGYFLLVVGASAVVFGTMGAATRFAFERGGSLWPGRARAARPEEVPARSLLASLRNRRALTFVLVWLGVDTVLAISGLSLTNIQGNIAWQAHIGGFLAGLIAFPLFDPVPRHPVAADPAEPDPGAPPL